MTPPVAKPTRVDRVHQRPFEVELELFTHRFGAIAAEMGEMLQRCAISTNIRDRLDFSCALLDPEGFLVVNAPHIPVHLGALGLCVRSVAAHLPMAEGDAVITNHPAFGGSHLPDVTVITPVFLAGRLLGYAASRAHHAEIGGKRPGSMPPDARCLAEEGVVISPRYLVRGGHACFEEIATLLGTAPWPTRALAENLADLDAALAANRYGATALSALAAREGAETVIRFMGELRQTASRKMQRALAGLTPGRYAATEHFDDGSPLSATLEIADGRAVIDFSGSAPVHPGNLNATPAIVRSALLYVLRLVLAEELPLNEGLLDVVEVKLPTGLLNPLFPEDPFAAPAVVGGNTETSQRLVDTLLRALGLVAGGQGTMNNVLFGNDRFGYYETVGGGAGATADRSGADAVHVHMTNTRLTDAEILERRYPVRVERFAIRRGSGGAGRCRGGDGIERHYRFLAPVQLSLLSQHRVEAPYGLAGGQAGACGRQWLERATGEREELPGMGQAEIQPGDLFVLETPGGGGWGQP